MLTFSRVLDFILEATDTFQVCTKGTEVQYPAVLEHLFVFRQQIQPKRSDSPAIMIYGRPRLPAPDHTKLRQDKDCDVLQAQWTKGTFHIAFNSVSRFWPNIERERKGDTLTSSDRWEAVMLPAWSLSSSRRYFLLLSPSLVLPVCLPTFTSTLILSI